MHEAIFTPSRITTDISADLAVQVVKALGYPARTVEVPVGTEFAECDYSSAHDHLDDRPAVVTIYGTETTLDVCRACAQNALDGFHVDTGNDPLRTTVEIAVLAQPQAYGAADWFSRSRLASVVDADGREGSVEAYESLFTGSRRIGIKVDGEFDATTPHGRAALAAIRTAIDTVLGGAA